MKQLPPGVTLNEFVEQYRLDLQKTLVQVAFWHCCQSCEHWAANSVERKGLCEQKCYKYGVVPPPDVILHSCESWLPVVPF